MKKFYETPELEVNIFSLTEDILGASSAEDKIEEHVEENWSGFGW